MKQKIYIELLSCPALTTQLFQELIQKSSMPVLDKLALSASGISDHGAIVGKSFICVDFICHYRSAPPELVKRTLDTQVLNKRLIEKAPVSAETKKAMRQEIVSELTFSTPPLSAMGKIIYRHQRNEIILMSDSKRSLDVLYSHLIALMIRNQVDLKRIVAHIPDDGLTHLVNSINANQLPRLHLAKVNYKPATTDEDGNEEPCRVKSITATSETQAVGVVTTEKGRFETLIIMPKFAADWEAVCVQGSAKDIDAVRLDILARELTSITNWIINYFRDTNELHATDEQPHETIQQIA